MEKKENTDQIPEENIENTQEENILSTETPETEPEVLDAENTEEEVTADHKEESPEDEKILGDLELNEKLQEVEAEIEQESEDLDEDDAETDEEIDYSTLDKSQLLEKLETEVNKNDISKAKNHIASIKVEFLRIIKEEKKEAQEKFLAEGGKPEDYKPAPDPAEEQFQKIFEIYKHKKAQFIAEFEKQKQLNLVAKLQILEDLKVLVNSEETLKKTYDEFKALQENWKEIGQVPRTEVNNLWQNYHFLVEKFFDKVKINKELKDLDLKKNLEYKISLCEKAEELLLSPSIHRSFKQLQKLHDEWKEVGPVPQDKKDEVWDRFKVVSDRINQMRKEYYNSLQEEQENNLLAKNALCEKVEALLTAEINGMQQWKEKTAEVTEFMKLWQAVGRAPASANDEIWQRFKKSINAFYNLKKDFFNSLKEQQINNYNLKVNLCLQAEALKTSNNWKQATQDFLKLQEEWKKIGPVPRKHSDKIWKRFRAACDEFFNSKSNYFSNINQFEDENMNKKLDIIKQIDEYPVSEDKIANLDALRNFQRIWMEIGHVPIAKKEQLQNDYRSAINRLLDRLKISSVEANTLQYKNKLENMQTSPDAGKAMFRERNMLESKISKLQSDINTWENNIGFLASSKNADLLKAEFDQKIKSAREELQLLKAKMKLLRRS